MQFTKKNQNSTAPYVNRQPIFDGKQRTVAYDILYRDMGQKKPGTFAPHPLLSTDLKALSGNKKIFIKISEGHLFAETAFMFSPGNTIISIEELSSSGKSLVKACEKIKKAGYMLALGDFVFQPEMEIFFPLLDIVKVDFQKISLQTFHKQAQLYRKKYAFKLLAENIHTYKEYDLACNNGFSLFKGPFFCQPERLKEDGLESANIQIVDLLLEVNKDEYSLVKIEEILTEDIELSDRLLRYINSSYYGLVQEVSTVKRAIAYLGKAGIRKFVNLMAVSDLSKNKPKALLSLSLHRAYLCQIIGEKSKGHVNVSELFFLGLFSLLDAILDMSMEEVTTVLPMSKAMREGLLRTGGQFDAYIQAVLSYEDAHFDTCSTYLSQLGIAPQEMPASYKEALLWLAEDEAKSNQDKSPYSTQVISMRPQQKAASNFQEQLDWQPHPEGGQYARFYNSEMTVQEGERQRTALTHIYFSLLPEELSCFHKVQSDEIWNLYEGEGMDLYIWDEETGALQEIELSKNSRQYCCVVQAGLWQATKPLKTGVLVGCSVAPGFIFEDFELLHKETPTGQALVQQFPHLEYLVKKEDR